MRRPPSSLAPQPRQLVPSLLAWFAVHARDLPWRRTRDPYAIWVSEIMLQQTQVKTVIPFWERWLRELPTIAAAAKARPEQLHKLWEGLGYYTRVRNLHRAAQQIVQNGKQPLEDGNADYQFPEKFEEVLALPGIGRYTAGAICSIAFNQPTPILDGNVIRVLTRIFGLAENPKEKPANAKLWQLAEELVTHAQVLDTQKKDSALCAAAPLLENNSCSHLNQSLMELGALICTPRNAQCPLCPVKKWCVAHGENRVAELPNLGVRTAATARRYVAFVVERDGRFLVRQRPAGGVNAQLWEFPNAEAGADAAVAAIFRTELGGTATDCQPLLTVKHSITRYRITLEVFRVATKKISAGGGVWQTPAQLQTLAFTSAHRKIVRALVEHSPA